MLTYPTCLFSSRYRLPELLKFSSLPEETSDNLRKIFGSIHARPHAINAVSIWWLLTTICRPDHKGQSGSDGLCLRANGSVTIPELAKL